MGEEGEWGRPHGGDLTDVLRARAGCASTRGTQSSRVTGVGWWWVLVVVVVVVVGGGAIMASSHNHGVCIGNYHLSLVSWRGTFLSDICHSVFLLPTSSFSILPFLFTPPYLYVVCFDFILLLPPDLGYHLRLKEQALCQLSPSIIATRFISQKAETTSVEPSPVEDIT